MQPIFLKQNFLSPDECRELIECYESNITAMGKNDVNPSFSFRTIDFQDLKQDLSKERQEAVHIMAKAKMLASRALSEFFEIQLYPRLSQLVSWRQGMFQGPHRDGVKQSNHAAVIYLNDGFQGGETFFADRTEKVTPETGKIVGFPSAAMAHGVTWILKGTRYTFPIWFTADQKFEEIGPT